MRTFIPNTATEPGQHRLLVLDGHDSQIETEFLWLPNLNEIELLHLPAHSPRILRPLDLSALNNLENEFE